MHLHPVRRRGRLQRRLFFHRRSWADNAELRKVIDHVLAGPVVSRVADVYAAIPRQLARRSGLVMSSDIRPLRRPPGDKALHEVRLPRTCHPLG